MAAIPAAPKENGGTGAQILFLTGDVSGSLVAYLLRAYQPASVDSQNLGDLGVYPTSGLPVTGYRETTGSSEIALSASSIPCQGVVVKASPDNTLDLWVGPTGITDNKTPSTEGYRLSAGESVGIACRNVNQVFIRSTATGQGAYFSGSKD